MRAKVVTVMRWYAQDEVNQEDSEQNEVDGMKKGADSTGEVMHMHIYTYHHHLLLFMSPKIVILPSHRG